MSSEFEVEPNNIFATANQINFGLTITGQLSNVSDLDLYKIIVSGSGILSTALTVPTDKNVLIGNYFNLTLYDSNGTNLSSYTTGQNKNYSFGIPSAGTYYIGFKGTGYFNYSDPYSITSTFTNGSYTGYEIEPNNTFSTANQINFGLTTTGQLSNVSDLDLYKIIVSGSGVLSTALTVPTDKNVLIGNYFNLTLYDSTGNNLGSYTTGQNKNYSFGIPSAGTYYISFKGTGYSNYSDAYSITPTFVIDVIQKNHAPVGKPVGFNAGNEDTNYILKSTDLLNGLTDADGDTLSITNLVTTNGSITANADGTWLLTPNKNFNGSLQISYTVTDNKGGNLDASFNFVLNPVNDAPIGKSTATFDAGNQNSTVFTFKDSDYFLGFSDPDGDALQAVNIKATNATITRDANGVWTLKPNANFSGTVLLAYDVIDNKGGSISAAMNFVVKHVNQSPTGIVSITGTATQNQILTASNNLADADGLGTISYTWLRDGTAINTATQSTYMLTQADVGKTLLVKASYTDLLGTAESVSSAATTAVANINDAPTGTVTITGTAIKNQILTASNNLADMDGLGVISYTWLRDGTIINSATQSTFTLTQADVGKKITVKASYTDLLGTAESVSSTATTTVAYVNTAPTGTVTITGTANQNQILTASNNLADMDGLGVISYTWLRDGTIINSATQSTYTLTQADVGKKLSVKASYTDALGTTESVSSAATTNVTNVNDIPTGNVTITGSAAMNQLLTASNNLADVDGLGAISYTWLRDGTAINAATQSTYTLTQADVGKSISVKGSYTDLLGTAESIKSSAVIPVKFINHLPTGTVTFSGAGLKGQVLSAANNLADVDGLGAISYTWLKNGIAIPNATQSTYKLTQIDTGQYISVKASYVDLQSTSESATSSTILVSANQVPTGAATVKGLPTWGTILSITSTIKDADGIGKLSYIWQNDKTTLSTSATYTLADSDIGKQVWAVVIYTDKKGNLEEVKSNVINVTISDKASAVNDVLTGTDGANKLNGLAGNDTLIGGLGKDSLTGGVGADVFKFNSINDSSALPKQADTITDFKHAQSDKIDLSDIDANSVLPNDQVFTLISAATFSAEATGQLRFDAKTSTLYGSTNADAAPEFAIVLSGVKTLVAEDLIL